MMRSPLHALLVAEGALTVRVFDAPQPVRVIRSGGADAEETLTSGKSITIAAGDSIVVPEHGTADLMNTATELAVVFLLVIPSTVAPLVNTGITLESLVGGVLPVSASLALTLEQTTLAPGASLPDIDAPTTERFIAPVDPDRMMDARIGSHGSLRNARVEPLRAYVLAITFDAALP